jgi:hypothetical protein
MDFLKNLATMGWLKGYRSYIIAALIIACFVAENFFGIDVPGFDAGSDWVGFVLAALGISTAKAAASEATK